MNSRFNRTIWICLMVFIMLAQNALLGGTATSASDQNRSSNEFAGSVASVSSGWELTKNGQSNVVIVKDESAGEVEQFAADELKSYLGRILGVEPEITSHMDPDKVNLVLGTPDSSSTVNSILVNMGIALTETNPGYDGYLIKSVIYDNTKTILLTGYTGRTVLYASYHLLETSGVRFYGQKSQPYEEVVPYSPDLTISDSLDIEEVPYTKYRMVNNNNFYAKNAKQLEKVADWAAKNRYNVFELWLRSADETYDKTILSKRGIEVWLGGHNWSQFIDTSNGAWYTNELNIQSFLANVLEYAKAHPDTKAIGIWQEDGLQGKIRMNDPYGKGQTWRFTEWNLYVTNRVAKLFQENSIPARVLWMAYGEGNVVPNPDYIKPEPNVDVVYYNMMQNYKYALSDDENNVPVEWMADPNQWRRGQNSDYYPEPIPDEKLSAGPVIRSWSNYLHTVGFTGNLVTVEHTNMNIGIWLPYPMLSYLQIGPWGLGEEGEETALQKDIQYLKSLGFNGWVNCYEFPDTSYNIPTHSPSPYWYRYLAEILWDPAADREELDRDFYKQYYGSLSEDMESYFAQVWAEIEADPKYKNGLDKLKVELLNIITTIKATADATGNQTLISRVNEVYQWHINTLIPRRENYYYVANGILRKPTDVVLKQNANSVSLSWNNLDNDSTQKPVVYQVERSTDLQSWTEVGETSERWRTPIRFVDMSVPDVDGTYYYRVRVVYGTGQEKTITEYTDPKSIVFKAVNAGQVISTGKPVSVSSSHEKDGWSKTKLNDGDVNGPKGWQSAQSSTGNKSEWAVIDLGSETSISSVAFLPESNASGIPVRFKIEVSNDSGFSNATVIADYSKRDYSPAQTDSPEFTLHNFPAPAGLKGRYVRLNVNQINMLWPGTYGLILTELMVLSKSTVAVSGVTIQAPEKVVASGRQMQLEAVIMPANATNKNVRWSSSDESVASIDSTGKLTALSPGPAVITVTTEDGEYTATLSITVSGNGNGNGSGNSNGSSGTSSVVKDGTVTVQPTLDASGQANVKLNTEDVAKASSTAKGKQLVIEVSGQGAQANSTRIEIPVKGIADSSSPVSQVVVKSGGTAITISTREESGILKPDSESIVVTVAKVDSDTLPADVRQKLDGNILYDFSLRVDGQLVSEFSTNDAVKVEIGYSLKSNENPHQIVAYYVSETGKISVVTNARYDAGSGNVVFQMSHFSKYAVAYAGITFSDLADAQWAAHTIEALAARGIVKGIGNGNVEPNRTITRYEFLQMLMTGLELTIPQAESTFSDVINGAWYYPALASAERLGIVKGNQDSTFGGERAITREEMAVLTYRALSLQSMPVSSSVLAKAFTDESAISKYALDAVTSIHELGIIKGFTDGSFRPRNTGTRAEASAIIYMAVLGN